MAFLAASAADSLELTLWDGCLRFLCAMVVGIVIGTEREYTHHPAGMRTHILVALGACTVMITGQLIFAQYSAYGSTPDPARLAAQVVTGVGFLGAGTILREGANVKGLTTAASLWAVACLGIAAGSGYYLVALTGMAFVFVTLTIFGVLQDKLISPHGCQSFLVRTADVVQGLDRINTLAKETHCQIDGICVEHLPQNGYGITFQAKFQGSKSKTSRQRFFQALAEDPAIMSVQYADDGAGVK